MPHIHDYTNIIIHNVPAAQRKLGIQPPQPTAILSGHGAPTANPPTSPALYIDEDTGAHGYLPKLSGATSQYLNGNGAYVSGTSLTNNAVTQSANYNVLLTDTFVLLSGAHTATMPSPTAANTSGHLFWIQCSSAGTNAILRNSSETFNGNMGTALTKLTNTAVGKTTMLWSDGANWWYVQL